MMNNGDRYQQESLVRAYRSMKGYAGYSILTTLVNVAQRKFGYTKDVSEAVSVLQHSDALELFKIKGERFGEELWAVRERNPEEL